VVHIEAQSDAVAIWVEFYRAKGIRVGAGGAFAFKRPTVMLYPVTPWRKRYDKETKEIVYEYLM